MMSRWLRIAVPLGIAAVVISVLAIGFGSASSLAAPGGNGKGNGDGHGGHSVTVPDGVFGGTTTATVNPGVGGDVVYVKAECFQNGTLVFRQYARVDSNDEAVIGLARTQLWTGGDATCTAEEGYFHKANGRWHVLASTTFNAYDVG